MTVSISARAGEADLASLTYLPSSPGDILTPTFKSRSISEVWQPLNHYLSDITSRTFIAFRLPLSANGTGKKARIQVFRRNGAKLLQTMEKNDVSTTDNGERSGESGGQNENLNDVKKETRDEAAQYQDPSAEAKAKQKADLAAKLMYEFLNYDKIKAEEAEARARVRDDEGEVLYTFHSRKIVRISEDLVVKKAGDLRAHEASNLRYIAANTTIPVPKVHDVRWEDDTVVGIVMDYMPGKSLEDVWDTLSPDQKQSIAEQLRGFISQLRGLKGDYIGAVDRGTVSTGKFTSIQGGPFDTEREFNEWILEDLSTGISAGLTHYARHALTDGHEIVFTHADFSSRNILVDVENCQVTAVLDWEFSGWYPEWWEHFTAYSSFQKGKDWGEYLCHILPPQYDREFVSMFYVSKLCRS